MNSDAATLNSISTQIGELTGRIAEVAMRYAGGADDDVATGLFEVERSLTAASRRLDKVVERMS